MIKTINNQLKTYGVIHLFILVNKQSSRKQLYQFLVVGCQITSTSTHTNKYTKVETNKYCRQDAFVCSYSMFIFHINYNKIMRYIL